MLRWALDSQTPRHVLPLGESGGVIGFLVPYYASTTASKPQRRPFRDPIVAQDLPRAFVYLIFPQATLDDQIATFNLYTPCATERMGPWRSSKRGLASLLTVQPASTVDLSSLQDITEPACQVCNRLQLAHRWLQPHSCHLECHK